MTKLDTLLVARDNARARWKKDRATADRDEGIQAENDVIAFLADHPDAMTAYQLRFILQGIE